MQEIQNAQKPKASSAQILVALGLGSLSLAAAQQSEVIIIIIIIKIIVTTAINIAINTFVTKVTFKHTSFRRGPGAALLIGGSTSGYHHQHCYHYCH